MLPERERLFCEQFFYTETHILPNHFESILQCGFSVCLNHRMIIYFDFSLVGDYSPIFNVTADVVFVVDSSNEVSSHDYTSEKRFVKSVARALNLASKKSRVAVIIYSDYATTPIKFADYQTTGRFNDAVDNLIHIRRTRRMDRALFETVEALKQARPLVPKLVFFLTSGRQDTGAPSLDAAARGVTETGAIVYLVAIGQRPNLRELRVVVEKPDNIISVTAFGDLQQQSRDISKDAADNLGECQ